MSSHRLMKRLRRLVGRNNALTAQLLCHMGEVDERRLYLEVACPSMFAYCTGILRMSDAQAFRRIRAARLARKFPVVLPMVHSGQIHLCALALLAPHMTEDNGEELLQQAVHLSKRQVEKLVASRFPSPAVPDSVRKLPKRRGGQGGGAGTDAPAAEPLLQHATTQPPVKPPAEPSSPPAPAKQPLPAVPAASAGKDQGVRRCGPATPGEHTHQEQQQADQAPAHGDTATTETVPASRVPSPEVSGTGASRRSRGRMTPLSADAYKIQFTAGQSLNDKLRQAQELLRHQVPDGDLATVFDRALDAYLPPLRKQRFAELSRPPKPSRARKSSEAPLKSRAQEEGPSRVASRHASTGDGAGVGGTAKQSAGGDTSRQASTDDGAGVGGTAKQPAGGDTSRQASTGDGDGVGGTAKQSSADAGTAKRSRHIPAEVRRQVAERDGYQCTYTDKTGHRCPERGLVEFHHVQPFGKDGGHEVANVKLLCRAHNAGAARHDYGDQVMERWRGQGADTRASSTVAGNSGPSPRTTAKDGESLDGHTQDTG